MSSTGRADAVLPEAAQQYARALVRDADQLIEDIENLLGRRNSLWDSIAVLSGWVPEDANDARYAAYVATFGVLREQSRIGDVDLLFELAAGRLLAASPARAKPLQPVSMKRSYRRRRAIRGPLVDLETRR